MKMKQFQFLMSVVIILTLAYHIKLSATSNVSKIKKKQSDKNGFNRYFPCNKTNNYPLKKIKDILRKNKEIYSKNKIFGKVIEPVDDIIPIARENLVAKEKNFCDTKKVIVFPKVAYDVDLQQRFIVNIKGYEQSVSFETCVEKRCFNGNLLPLNFATRCKQLYNTVRLLYYNINGTLEHGRFLVPSTCTCTYTKQFL